MNESTAPATCLRKRAYASEAEAWSVIFRIRAKGQDSERLKPYTCDECRRWHLGREHPAMRAPVLRALRDVTGERPDAD